MPRKREVCCTTFRWAILAVAYALYWSSAIALANDTVAVDNTGTSDWRFKNACAPISLWSACCRQRCGLSLGEVCRRCKYEDGKSCSIRQIADAMRGVWSLNALAAKLSPAELKSALARGESVVLFIRNGGSEINHAVCALRFEAGGYVVVDYPQVTRIVDESEMRGIWDGQAVVVKRSFLGWIWCHGDVIVCVVLVSSMCSLLLTMIKARTRYGAQVRPVSIVQVSVPVDVGIAQES